MIMWSVRLMPVSNQVRCVLRLRWKNIRKGLRENKTENVSISNISSLEDGDYVLRLLDCKRLREIAILLCSGFIFLTFSACSDKVRTIR